MWSKNRKSDVRRPRSQRVRSLETLESRQLMSLGSEFLVNTTTGGAQFASDNASAANGRSVVVWTDFSNSSDHVIRAQRYDQLQHKTGPEIIVAHIGSDSAAGNPSVAMGPTGNFVVSWTQTNGSGDTNVLARQYTSPGNPKGGIVNVGVGTFREHDSDVAIDDSGRFTVSYTRDTNNNNPDVFAKRYDSNGNQLNVFNVAVGPKVEDKSSIAVTPDGRISVAYELTFSPTDDDVLLARFGSDGSSLGTTSIATSGAREKAPSISVDNSGNAVVAYQKLVGNSFDIEAKRVSSTGSVGSEITIQSTTTDETSPAVALKRGGGGFVVAYNAGTAVKVSEVSSSDTVTSTLTTSSRRDSPAISIDGSNRYLLTYTSNDLRPFPSLFDRNIRGRFGRLS